MTRRLGEVAAESPRKIRGTPRPRTGTSGSATDPAAERLIDVHEAARLLGLKPATLYQWAYKRRIPVVKLFGPRGALRFHLNDVLQLIQDSRRPAGRQPGASK